MLKEKIAIIECPLKLDMCKGLAVSICGSGIGLDQKDNGYIVSTNDGERFFGNCGNYQQCMGWLIRQTRNSRGPIKTRPYSE